MCIVSKTQTHAGNKYDLPLLYCRGPRSCTSSSIWALQGNKWLTFRHETRRSCWAVRWILCILVISNSNVRVVQVRLICMDQSGKRGQRRLVPIMGQQAWEQLCKVCRSQTCRENKYELLLLLWSIILDSQSTQALQVLQKWHWLLLKADPETRTYCNSKSY